MPDKAVFTTAQNGETVSTELSTVDLVRVPRKTTNEPTVDRGEHVDFLIVTAGHHEGAIAAEVNVLDAQQVCLESAAGAVFAVLAEAQVTI